MKKTLILMAAASAFVLTGCTENDLSGGSSFANGSSSAIEFSAKTGNTGMTRAGFEGDLTNESIRNSGAGFGVFAYYSQNSKFATWASWNPTTPTASTQAPNFMYNEHLTWSSGKNGWDYSPVKYWPNGKDTSNPDNTPSNTATEANAQYLSFFAYAPYVQASDASYVVSNEYVGGEASVPTEVGEAVFTGTGAPTAVTNGIVAMSKNDQGKDMYVKYILNPADATKFVDLTWGLRGQITYQETDEEDNTVAGLGTEYNTDLTKQVVGEKVKFLFKHALSRVGGNTSTTTSASSNQICGLWVVADIDKNSSVDGAGQSAQTDYFSTDFNNEVTLVTIEEVKIQDNYSYNFEKDPSTTVTSDFLTDGWFDIMNGTWSNTAKVLKHTTNEKGVIYNVDAKNSGTPSYSLNQDIMEPTTPVSKTNITAGKWSISGTTGVTTAKKEVYAATEDVPGLLLIPGESGNNTLYITVKYIVRTVDSKLSTGFSEVTQTITNKVTLSNDILDPNKYYNLVMHLGLTSVKFEAVVSNWSNGDDKYDEDGGETTPGAGDDKSIWLPSNVVSNSISVTAGTLSKSVIVPAATTSYTIKVTGLTSGNKVSVVGTNKADGKVSITPASPATVSDGTATVTITGMDANTTAAAAISTITVTEKNDSEETVTTTTVTLTQAGIVTP